MLTIVRFPGNWTLEYNEETAYLKIFFTHPKSGKPALYSIEPGENKKDPLPEWQPLVHEVPAEDGTIGLICPFVTKVKGQWYVAVERNVRHAGERVEVPRKAWDKPDDLPKISDNAKIDRVDLGRGDSNTARIVGGDGIVDEIVVLSGIEELPNMPGKPFWMKFETFAKKHRDHMGAAVIGKAFMVGALE